MNDEGYAMEPEAEPSRREKAAMTRDRDRLSFPEALDRLDALLSQIREQVDRADERLAVIARPEQPFPSDDRGLTAVRPDASELAVRVDRMAAGARELLRRLDGLLDRVDL